MDDKKVKIKKKRKFRLKIPISKIILFFTILLTVTVIVANIVRDKSLIKENKSMVVKSNNNYNSVTKKDKNLDIDSRLVKNLYRLVYDERKGNLKSWIYPDVDKLLISDMDQAAKLKLVISNMENAYFSDNDCNVRGSKTLTINEKKYTCDNTSDGYISVDDVLNKYIQLYGNSNGFDKTLSIVANGSDNAIFIYAIDKVTNKEGYYRYVSSDGNVGNYTYSRKLVKAIETGGVISITENIVITDNQGQKKEENIVYTFTLAEDGVYTYYSRVRNQA